MGGSDSKERLEIENSISLETNKQIFQAGDICAGVVNMNIKKSFKTRQVNINLVGIEKINISSQKLKDLQAQKKENSAQHLIVNKRQVLQIFQDGKCHKGKTYYPFSFQLENDIPGTFSLYYGSASGSIEYYLEVEILPSKIGDPIFKKSVPINVVQSLPTNYLIQNNLTKHEQMVQVSQFLCMNSGSTNITCQFDKPYYYQGEYANLTMNIDNKNCNKKITSIQFKIDQTVKIGRKDRFHNYDDDDSQFIKERQMFKFTKKIEVKPNKSENDIKVPFDLSKLDQFCCFGNFIECGYVLSLTVNYHGFMIFSQSEINIPIYYLQKGQFNQYYDNYQNYNQVEVYQQQQQIQQFQNVKQDSIQNQNQVYPIFHQNSGSSYNQQIIDYNNNQQFVLDDAMQQQIQQQQQQQVQQNQFLQQNIESDEYLVLKQNNENTYQPQNEYQYDNNNKQNQNNDLYNYPAESQQLVQV